ncbi:hypothetical protein AGMMS50255_7790 [Spirochaetia bacterium]|nr:hypothetical protein AGMMS50255_7790 [Spirochaetia bacterium]
MKKKFVLLMAIVAISFMMMGCASLAGPAIPTSQNVSIQKTGTAEAKVWLGVFGRINYPTIEEAAKAGGITKIATVERYAKLGIFGLWTDYTTIVTGE